MPMPASHVASQADDEAAIALRKGVCHLYASAVGGGVKRGALGVGQQMQAATCSHFDDSCTPIARASVGGGEGAHQWVVGGAFDILPLGAFHKRFYQAFATIG